MSNFTKTSNNFLVSKSPISISLNFNLKLFWIFSIISITFLLFFYIFQINEMAKSSYLISQYKKDINYLSQESETIQANLYQTGSLENIDKLVMELNFEPVTKVHYIKVLEKAVVRNNK